LKSTFLNSKFEDEINKNFNEKLKFDKIQEALNEFDKEPKYLEYNNKVLDSNLRKNDYNTDYIKPYVNNLLYKNENFDNSEDFDYNMLNPIKSNQFKKIVFKDPDDIDEVNENLNFSNLMKKHKKEI
jgi:hypothetical protein